LRRSLPSLGLFGTLPEAYANCKFRERIKETAPWSFEP
jgi:hypothetical protein